MLDGRFDPAFAIILGPEEIEHLEELTTPVLIVSLLCSFTAIAALIAVHLLGTP